jgi:hypothetical protein
MSDQRADLDLLLTAAVIWIRKFVVMSETQANACALWAAHTHAFDTFKFTPYLHVSSATKRSGKTRVLEVLYSLVADPEDMDGITPAALIRIVDQERPTLLIDEIDAAFGGDKDLSQALRGILNSGFRSRGNFRKCEGEGANMKVRKFATFCPKAFAGIGRLPDTIEDRSIPIRLRPRIVAQEPITEFDEEEWEFQARTIAAGFKDALAAGREQLAEANPERPHGISDRAKDVWKPLLGIADLAGGGWPERARKAAGVLCGPRDPEEEEINVRLLDAVRRAFVELDTDKLLTTELLDFLHAQEDEPWADWSRGNGITARRVADLLRPLGIKKKTIRVGERRGKGYRLDDLEQVLPRYFPPEDVSIGDMRANGSSKPETDPSLSVTREPMSPIENGKKPHEQAIVTDVTDRKPEPGDAEPELAAEEGRRVVDEAVAELAQLLPVDEADARIGAIDGNARERNGTRDEPRDLNEMLREDGYEEGQ